MGPGFAAQLMKLLSNKKPSPKHYSRVRNTEDMYSTELLGDRKKNYRTLENAGTLCNFTVTVGFVSSQRCACNNLKRFVTRVCCSSGEKKHAVFMFVRVQCA